MLTFDDGPWPNNTPAVLKALAEQCTKALFFPIGKHAGWHPEILKQVIAAGHTVGSHTWSHKDLSKVTEQEGKDEIEKGIAAVSIALGNKPVAAFFRFPGAAPSAGAREVSRRAQRWHLLDRLEFVRLQDASIPSRW